MRHIDNSIIDLKDTAFCEPVVTPRGNASPDPHKGQQNAHVPLSVLLLFCKKLRLPENLPMSNILLGNAELAR
jgi:hypothetical protein